MSDHSRRERAHEIANMKIQMQVIRANSIPQRKCFLNLKWKVTISVDGKRFGTTSATKSTNMIWDERFPMTVNNMSTIKLALHGVSIIGVVLIIAEAVIPVEKIMTALYNHSEQTFDLVKTRSRKLKSYGTLTVQIVYQMEPLQPPGPGSTIPDNVPSSSESVNKLAKEADAVVNNLGQHNAASTIGNIGQGIDTVSETDAFSTVISLLENLLQITDTLAEVNSWVKLGWSVLSVIPKSLIAQVNRNDRVKKLWQTAADMLSFCKDVNFKIDSLLEKVIEEMMKQVAQCAAFICRYGKKGFFSHAARDAIDSSVDNTISKFMNSFTDLQAKFARCSDLVTLRQLDELSSALDGIGSKLHRMESFEEFKLLGCLPIAANMRCKLDNVCLPGTREALLDEITKWMMDSTEPVYWLYGVGGSGKSTVANTIAARFKNLGLLGASYQFNRDMGQQNDAKHFLGTIVYQLAHFNSRFKEELLKAIERQGQLEMTGHPSELAKSLLVDIVRMAGFHVPILIVVDAVDEGGSEVDREVLLDVIVKQLGNCGDSIKFLITSRPEPDIRAAFEHFHMKDISTTANTRTDIRAYIDDRMMDISKRHKTLRNFPDWPGPVHKEKLADEAAELFIWVTVAYLYISKHIPPELSLQEVLSGGALKTGGAGEKNALNKLYLQVLQRAKEERLPRELSSIKYVLGALVCLAVPLTAPALDSLLGLGEKLVECPMVLHDGTSIQLTSSNDVIDSLASIIRLDSGVVRFLHPSIINFLTSDSLRQTPDADFFVDVPLHHQYLAYRCFEIMTGLKRDYCSIGHHYSSNAKTIAEKKVPDVLRYSCRYWPRHLVAILAVDSTPVYSILDLLEDFLSKRLFEWLEIMSLLGMIPEVFSGLTEVQERLQQTRSKTETICVLLGDTLHCLEQFNDVMKNSPHSRAHESTNSIINTSPNTGIVTSNNTVIKNSPGTGVVTSNYTVVNNSLGTGIANSNNSVIENSVRFRMNSGTNIDTKNSPWAVVNDSANIDIKNSPRAIVHLSTSSAIVNSIQAIISEGSNSVIEDSVQSIISHSANSHIKDSPDSKIHNSSNSVILNSPNSFIVNDSDCIIYDSPNTVAHGGSTHVITHTLHPSFSIYDRPRFQNGLNHINNGPAYIYTSIIPFLPSDTLLYEKYHDMYDDIPRVIHGLEVPSVDKVADTKTEFSPNYTSRSPLKSTSRDGKRFICSSDDQKFDIWDVSNLQPVQVGSSIAVQDANIICIDFISEGQVVTADDQGVVSIWDVADVTTRKELPVLDDSCVVVSFKLNQGILICLYSDGRVVGWKVGTGEPVWDVRLDIETSRSGSNPSYPLDPELTGLELSKTGAFAQTTLQHSNKWQIFDTMGGEAITERFGWLELVSTEFSDNDQRMVAHDCSRKIYLCDPATGNVLWTQSHDWDISGFLFLECGDVITWGNHHIVRHGADTGDIVRRWIPRINCTPITSVIISSDQSRLVCAVWDVIYVYSLADNHPLAICETHTLDCHIAIALLKDRLITLRDTNSDYHISVFDTSHHSQSSICADSPSERLDVILVVPRSGGYQLVTVYSDCTLQIWNVITGKAVGKPFLVNGGEVQAPIVDQPREVQEMIAATFSPTDKLFVVASRDTIYIWTVDTWMLLHCWKSSYSESIKNVAFSPDGCNVICVRGDCTTCAIRVDSGTPILGLPDSPTWEWADLLPDGNRILSVSNTGLLQYQNAWTGENVGERWHIGFPGIISIAVFSLGGQFAALIVDSWGSTNTDFSRHQETLECIASVYQSKKYSVVIIDTSSGASDLLIEDPHSLASPSFSHNGQLFACIVSYTEVRIWDLVSKLPSGPPLVHNGKVKMFSFLENRMQLVSIMQDDCDIATVQIWDIAQGSLISCYHGLKNCLSIAHISAPEINDMVLITTHESPLLLDLQLTVLEHNISDLDNPLANSIVITVQGRIVFIRTKDTCHVWSIIHGRGSSQVHLNKIADIADSLLLVCFSAGSDVMIVRDGTIEIFSHFHSDLGGFSGRATHDRLKHPSTQEIRWLTISHGHGCSRVFALSSEGLISIWWIKPAVSQFHTSFSTSQLFPFRHIHIDDEILLRIPDELSTLWCVTSSGRLIFGRDKRVLIIVDAERYLMSRQDDRWSEKLFNMYGPSGTELLKYL